MPPDCPNGECVAGSLHAEISGLRARVDASDKQMERIAADVRALLEIAATGKGTLRTLLVVGGALASFGAWLWSQLAGGAR